MTDNELREQTADLASSSSEEETSDEAINLNSPPRSPTTVSEDAASTTAKEGAFNNVDLNAPLVSSESDEGESNSSSENVSESEDNSDGGDINLNDESERSNSDKQQSDSASENESGEKVDSQRNVEQDSSTSTPSSHENTDHSSETSHDEVLRNLESESEEVNENVESGTASEISDNDSLFEDEELNAEDIFDNGEPDEDRHDMVHDEGGGEQQGDNGLNNQEENEDLFTGNLPEHGDEPLYDGSPISLAESMLALLTFTLTHNLTGACLADLLKLVCLHFNPSPRMKSTCYKFWSYFSGIKSPLIRHFYCPVCFQYLERRDLDCQCENRDKESYFIEIPIVSQLQRLFLKPGFVADLEHKYRRQRKFPNSVQDIYDGILYRNHSREGSILSDRRNISFLCYTDSTRVFHSSKLKILPLYLVINELPYRKRVLKDNIIVAGIWFGKSDPQMNLFLRPIHTQFTKLFEGVDLRIPGTDLPRRVRGLLLGGTGDTPARADMINHVRFNGYYGCMNCKAKGEYLTEDHVMVFPHEGPLDLRTNNEHQQHAERALAEEEPVYGCKGPAVLSRSMPDIIRGMGLDVMHCIFLGVVKRLTELWFSKGSRYCNYSLSNFADLVDSRLHKMKVPSNVHRLPRKLTEDLANWKASEWKMWFFYYSVPILKDLMKEKYFLHYLQLVLAISILCRPCLSEADIDQAEVLLKAFVLKIPSLYHRKFMTINFHLLLHFADCVRNLGPLYVYSCFPFEDLNGVLLQYVHGTRQVGLQIYTSAAHSLVLPSLIQNLPEESLARAFCSRLATTGKRMVIREVINEKTFVCGKMKYPSVLSNELVQAMLDLGLRVNGISVGIFQRCRKGTQTIYSTSYGRTPSSVSHHVIVMHRGQRYIALPKYFIRLCYCETEECPPECNGDYYAWVVYGPTSTPFQTTPSPLESDLEDDGEDTDNYNNEKVTVPYIHEFALNCLHDQKTLVPISSIQCVCFSMQVGQAMYVGEPVNLEEFE